MRKMLSVAIAGLIIGCASTSPSVSVDDAPVGIERLAGIWEGKLFGIDQGMKMRAGTVTLNLSAAPDSAYGMIVLTMGRVDFTSAPAGDGSSDEVGMQALAVPVVFRPTKDSEISAQLPAYRDSICQCTLRPLLRGTLEGNKIDGTYTLQRVEGVGKALTGSWFVFRNE